MSKIITLIFTLLLLGSVNSIAGGFNIVDTDAGDFQLVGFYDLRDRESFIQITNTDSSTRTIHIQLFDVGNNCNENNFFDDYTPNDTHVYNIRDIVTNDGNPAGVELPDGAYGIFVATLVNEELSNMLGNMRIEDNNGYEYRTNLNGIGIIREFTELDIFSFNYNSSNGVILSDVVGIFLDDTAMTDFPAEVQAADILNIWIAFDIDIYNLNEVPFSCRNVIFACTDQDNPQLESLLETANVANVASFEYGINNAIPHSKGGELLCPGNVITDGIVNMTQIASSGVDFNFVLYVGLNNGNGRGSMDSLWYYKFLEL